MIVQKIYCGWALFGVVVFGALAFTLVHTMMVWREPIPRGLSLLSFLPAGHPGDLLDLHLSHERAPQNWTVTPENLQIARQQWEYSHAVNALITFASGRLAGRRQCGGRWGVPVPRERGSLSPRRWHIANFQ